MSDTPIYDQCVRESKLRGWFDQVGLFVGSWRTPAEQTYDPFPRLARGGLVAGGGIVAGGSQLLGDQEGIDYVVPLAKIEQEFGFPELMPWQRKVLEDWINSPETRQVGFTLQGRRKL